MQCLGDGRGVMVPFCLPKAVVCGLGKLCLAAALGPMASTGWGQAAGRRWVTQEEVSWLL